MDAKNYFSGIANRYERNRPDYPSELFQYLAMSCNDYQLAWDAATGSGQAAFLLANQFDRVVATDISEEQIQHAKLKSNIEYKVEAAEACSLADNSVDLITVAQALHWLEPQAFFEQVTRVLKPGGILAVWSYPLLSVNPQVDKVLQELYGTRLKDYWSARRQWVEQAYDHVEFPYPLEMAPSLNMQQTWSYQQLMGYLSTWSATQRYIEENEEDPVLAISKPLEFAWCDISHLKKVTWQLNLKICRKPA